MHSTPLCNSQARAARKVQPLYVIDNPLMAYDASGYDPTILREAFVDEGKRLLADALARMKHENVAGTPRMVDVAPIGEDISEGVSARRRTNSMRICWCSARTAGVASGVCFSAASPNACCAVRAVRCYWCRAGRRRPHKWSPPKRGTPMLQLPCTRCRRVSAVPVLSRRATRPRRSPSVRAGRAWTPSLRAP